MLRFEAYRDGQPAEKLDLSGAYLFGQDEIPIRADLASEGNQVRCLKHLGGAAGLAILWEAGKTGRYLLSTTRLMDRRDPYNLNVELARAQVMRLYRKREDWGLMDYANAEGLNREFEDVRKTFVEAMTTNVTDPAEASVLADQALEQGTLLGEKTALFHAGALSSRRSGDGASRLAVGCGIDLTADDPGYQELIRPGFDFIRIPTSWRRIESENHVQQFGLIDAWMNWAARESKAVHAGPLLSFDPSSLPEWTHVLKNDFEALKAAVLAHVQRVVERYARQAKVWIVLADLNAQNPLDLGFDQILELCGACCRLVKTLTPHRQAVIDLTQPWGEYYARNQRTIPPLLFADVACQSDVEFDAFGAPIQMGVPVEGYFVRDLMQISSLLDELIPHGRKVHLTACAAPSSGRVDRRDAWGGQKFVSEAGQWHAPWSETLQAEWMQAVLALAASKPHVASLCWSHLSDAPGRIIPHGGLCRGNLHPKAAYRELLRLRAKSMENQ